MVTVDNNNNNNNTTMEEYNDNNDSNNKMISEATGLLFICLHRNERVLIIFILWSV